MAGKIPIELQKQLLASESEVLRAHLALEWQAMKEEGRALANVGRKIAGWASSAALLMSFFTKARAKKKRVVTRAKVKTQKTSWTKKMLGGARLATTVWKGFRAGGR